MTNFKGVVDLVKMKSIYWNEDEKGSNFSYDHIPSEIEELALEWRERLLESAAEADEKLLEKYLIDGTLNPEDIISGLRERSINNEIVVTMCGSAFKNKGVQPLLDGVIDFLPSPTDVPPINGEDARKW